MGSVYENYASFRTYGHSSRHVSACLCSIKNEITYLLKQEESLSDEGRAILLSINELAKEADAIRKEMTSQVLFFSYDVNNRTVAKDKDFGDGHE